MVLKCATSVMFAKVVCNLGVSLRSTLLCALDKLSCAVGAKPAWQASWIADQLVSGLPELGTTLREIQSLTLLSLSNLLAPVHGPHCTRYPRSSASHASNCSRISASAPPHGLPRSLLPSSVNDTSLPSTLGHLPATPATALSCRPSLCPGYPSV